MRPQPAGLFSPLARALADYEINIKIIKWNVAQQIKSSDLQFRLFKIIP
jgi:hypothetical protein